MIKNKINSDMTKGNLWRQMLVFSIPLMFSNLIQVLFNMADLAVVGRFSGSLALGSVGSTSMVVNLFVGFVIGESSGINVLTARAVGAGDEKDAGKTVHTAFLLNLIIGLILGVFGLASAKAILVAMNTKAELLDGAVTYLRIYMLGMPALGIFNFGNAALSAVGETKKPLYFLSFSGILNILLNLFFVIVLNMSTAGVAISTAISQYAAAILVLRELAKTPHESIRLKASEIKIYKDKAKALLGICLPSGFQYSVFYIANIFVQVGINKFDAVMVSGNAAASNADGIVYDVMAAVYTAISSFVGQNYGAGNKKRVLKSFLVGLCYSMGIGIVLGGGIYVFGREFLSLFAKEKEVIDAGMEKIAIMGVTYWISAFMDSLIAVLRGLGKTMVSMYIVIFGSCIFRLIWIYFVFGHFGTILSLYLVYAASWLLTALLEFIYFAYTYKKEFSAQSL